MPIKYKLAAGSQVREEDFGLLFYRMNGPRLYFISSGELLSPEFFEGEMTLEEWLNERHEDGLYESGLPGLKNILGQLCEKGVIIER